MLDELQSSDNEAFIEELRECGKLLAERLQQPDYDGAKKVIDRLVEARDQSVYQAVGKLTRGLHSALVNFNVDSSAQRDKDLSEIEDASERLNYVIETTQKAADKTMDLVEASAPVAMSIGQEAKDIHEEWGRLKRREMTPDEFRGLYDKVDQFLLATSNSTDQLNGNFQEILLAQDFQDLTGQVIKRVISLVQHVEKELVELVRVAGHVEEITGLATDTEALVKEKREEIAKGAEGPQTHADKQEDVVSGQDDVDDLLSSLGF